MGIELEEHFQNTHMCRVVSAFVIVYHLQDCLIHKVALAHDSSLTLAEREEYWIRTGGPEKFFSDHPWARLEMFKKDRYAAWNGFQALLFARHAEHCAFTLGHVPLYSQLVDPEWVKWNDRLRRRFAPIFACEE